MADIEKKAKWQEIANRGLQDNFDPQTRAKFDEAVNRGLITIPANQNSQNLVSQIRQNQPQAVEGLQASSAREANTPKPKTSFTENVMGLGDAAVTMARGSVGVPVGGALGLIKTGAELLKGGEDPLRSGAETSQNVQQMITGQPFSEAGRDALGMISLPIEKLGELSRGAGNKVLDATGSPALATITQTALETAPMALGLKRGGKTINERNVDVNQVIKETQDLGLDVGSPIARQRDQLVESGKSQTSGQVNKAQDMGLVQEAVLWTSLSLAKT
jgi:hypothetical protein